MGSVEKGEIKVGAAHELGCRFDDFLESCKKEGHQWEGAVSALVKVEASVMALVAHVDKEVDDGKLDLEQAKLVKQWLGRAAQVSHNLKLEAQNHIFIAQGKINAAASVVAATKKYKDEELGKVAAVQAEVRGKEPDGRPGPSIKERRLAEEAAAAPAKPSRKKTKRK